MPIKSFGLHVLEKICLGHLTVPILARALGAHLGQFECWMENGSPPSGVITNLAHLTRLAWIWGPIKEYSDREIAAWVKDYECAEMSDRVTITETPWEEPHLAKWQEIDPNPTTRQEWLIVNPVVTLECYRSTWVLKAGPGWDPKDELHQRGWRASQEMEEDKKVTVWRWNPLELSRPLGKPPGRLLKSKEREPVNVTNFRHNKIAQYLLNKLEAGIELVTIQEISILTHNKILKDPYLQVLRRDLTALGCRYDSGLKKWRIPRV